MATVAVWEGRNHAEAQVALLAADDAATLTAIPDGGNFAVQISATAFTGTVTFEATVNGTTWVAVELLPFTDMLPSATSLTSTATAAGVFVGSIPLAVSGFRARCSAFTSQTAAFATVRWTRN